MRILNHPNIVKLLEVIDTEETLLIVKEYLSGGDFFSHWSSKPDFEAQGPLGPNHHGSGSNQGQKQGKKKELLKPSKVFSEVNSMRTLNHPNIVKLLDVFDTRRLCL